VFFCPPLIITPDQIDEMVDAVAAALDEAYAVAQQRGLLGRVQSAAG
jgi:adenosylmethionine-8-amino-7-oxononanoate aminotransferase